MVPVLIPRFVVIQMGYNIMFSPSPPIINKKRQRNFAVNIGVAIIVLLWDEIIALGFNYISKHQNELNYGSYPDQIRENGRGYFTCHFSSNKLMFFTTIKGSCLDSIQGSVHHQSI